MTEHPLTNKKLFKKFWDYTVDADLMGQVFYTPDGMRAAYDRGCDHQLKQVIEWMKVNLMNHDFHEGYDYLYDDCSNAYIKEDELLKDLREAMRPTQENN